MLEEAADDRADANVVADAWHCRTQAADPAHHQVHRDARLRRAIEQPDHLIVGDGVDLHHQPRRTASLGVLDLPLDQLLEALPELHGRDDHRPELLLIGVAGQVVEDVGDVIDDVRIRGEETEVRVHLRGVGVVVPGARMNVALNPARLLTDDETELGVRLQIGEAVHHVDAMRLQPLGPQDVVPLVESRLQFNEDGDLLARFGCGDEQRNERRIRADAVQRHLDRCHMRIL